LQNLVDGMNRKRCAEKAATQSLDALHGLSSSRCGQSRSSASCCQTREPSCVLAEETTWQDSRLLIVEPAREELECWQQLEPLIDQLQSFQLGSEENSEDPEHAIMPRSTSADQHSDQIFQRASLGMSMARASAQAASAALTAQAARAQPTLHPARGSQAEKRQHHHVCPVVSKASLSLDPSPNP
jgi:hypothetical protein